MTFSMVHNLLRADANSGKLFFMISKDLGYVNEMIKRHFSEFARRLKNQNKDPTAFHVATCSPLHHNSKPTGELSLKYTLKTVFQIMQLYIHCKDTQNASLHMISNLVLDSEVISNIFS